MTDKRFELIEVNGNIEDSCTQIVYDGGEDVFELLDLLNSLDDENEQLRKENECDKQVFTKKRLHELLQQTQKENEYIKQTIKDMMENERTELGQSVLRQLWEAIQ